MMTFPIEWKNKSHVPVTTNQLATIVFAEHLGIGHRNQVEMFVKS
jgi:hypothetical protein